MFATLSVFCFTLAFILTIALLLRFVIHGAAEWYKHDTGTPHRKYINKKLKRHFIITMILYLIAFLTQYR